MLGVSRVSRELGETCVEAGREGGREGGMNVVNVITSRSWKRERGRAGGRGVRM